MPLVNNALDNGSVLVRLNEASSYIECRFYVVLFEYIEYLCRIGGRNAVESQKCRRLGSVTNLQFKPALFRFFRSERLLEFVKIVLCVFNFLFLLRKHIVCVGYARFVRKTEIHKNNGKRKADKSDKYVYYSHIVLLIPAEVLIANPLFLFQDLKSLLLFFRI